MKRRISNPRRGTTVAVVLAVIAVTLGLAYAMMRTQATVESLEGNLNRTLDARAAARAGVTLGLQRMHLSNWAGVNTTLTGKISATESFSVTFTAGDASLTADHPDYAKLPFRVTFVSTGTAQGTGTTFATHRIRVVAELIPQRLSTTPETWTSLQSRTAYVWDRQDTIVSWPARIQGRFTLGGRLLLCEDYPWSSRSQYLQDLQAMRLAGLGDHRPLSGDVDWISTLQTSNNISLLTGLSVPTVSSFVTASAPLAHPGTVQQYRLFAGGPWYTIPLVRWTDSTGVSNLTLEPNPATNPLGIYRTSGALYVNNDVTIRGTLIASGATPEVRVFGQRVRLESVDLPTLAGSSTRHQLPVAILGDGFRIREACRDVSVRGFLRVGTFFDVAEGDDDVTFSLQGRVVSQTMTLRKRAGWSSGGDWDARLAEFLAQRDDPDNGSPVRYFPEWMEKYGLTATPRITLAPDPTNPTYHWPDWTQPIFRAAADGRQRWDVVEWQEN